MNPRLWRALGRNVAALHRAAALWLMCERPRDDRQTGRVLRHLLDESVSIADWPAALIFAREMARRASDAPRSWYAVAEAAYGAGQVSEGDAAAAEGDRLCGPACAMRPESLARKAEAARTLAALGDRTDLDSELARAEAWELLDPERARAAYERIAAAYPGDVRAPARLLDHDLFLARDLRGACGQVENAGPDGRDSEYYAALVQCGWAGLLRTIADRAGGPRTSQEDADALSTWQRFLVAAEEYAAVDARHAVMLRMIALEVASWLGIPQDRTAEAMEALHATTGGDWSEWLARQTNDPWAGQLLLFAANMQPTADEAFAALAAAPQPSSSSQCLWSSDEHRFVEQRLAVYLANVVVRGASERLSDLDRFLPAVWPRLSFAVGAAPGSAAAAAFRADLAAVSWRLGVGPWDAAAVRDAYVVAGDTPGGEGPERARVANNLGVALAVLGEGALASWWFRGAEQKAGADADVPRFNRSAVVALAGWDGELRGVLSSLPPEWREHAPVMEWEAWLAEKDGRHDEAAALRRRTESVDAEDRAAGAGLMLRSQFIDVSFHGCPAGVPERLFLTVSLHPRLWLVLWPGFEDTGNGASGGGQSAGEGEDGT